MRRKPVKLILATMIALSSPHLAAAQDLSGGVEVKRLENCSADQQFYIRRDIIATQVLQCASHDDPASFSFHNNGIADTWTASADISLAYAIAGLALNGGTGGGSDSYIADSKLLVFGRLDGARNSGGTTTGFARAGLNYEAVLQPSGGFLSYSVLDATPYFQTDLDGVSSGYGLDLAYTPAYGPGNLNAIVRAPDQPTVFYTTAIIRVDGFYSDNPSNTALTQGDTYAWLGGDLGAGVQVYDGKRKLLDFSLGVEAYYDPVSGRDAVLGKASLELPLNKAGNASLTFSYSKGRPRQTMVDADLLKVGLGLKF
jgi:hypothetical protein